MPRIPITMPQLGESIAEATIVNLPCKIGDEVEADQEVIEVETNKATMGVTTPCRGTIAEITVSLQQTYSVGTILAYLEVTDEEAKRTGFSETTPEVRPQTMAGGQSLPSKVTPVVHGLPSEHPAALFAVSAKV